MSTLPPASVTAEEQQVYNTLGRHIIMSSLVFRVASLFATHHCLAIHQLGLRLFIQQEALEPEGIY